ncbi:autotransporter outer membrane beta-barrel domain-containing protein [Aquabacter sp. CN5-332]|uniref:autotransporter outer membrane beta-barrel domain-containing protein n=1 Tax=Aquabacter sp. CN5-332 TaxID=3156608 RepID=UPI0032B3CE9F
MTSSAKSEPRLTDGPRHRRLAAALLLGTTSLVAIMAQVDSARAQTPIRVVAQGANGTNGQILFNVRTFPTAGSPGGPVNRTNSTSLIGMTSTAIELGSIGGWGGSGDFGILRNVAGANGGEGGAVTLTNTATVSGGTNNTVATALIFLYSQGGTGGNGFKTSDGGLGAGGKGGDVTLDLRSAVTATGNLMPAIYLRSEGGASGVSGTTHESRGGTNEDRMAADAGGIGGVVKATLTQSAAVVTTGANAPAVVLASIGGAGGNATGNTSTYYASNGGSGGTVTFSSAGKIETAGDNASAVVLQSVGGTGGRGGGGAFTSAAPGAAGGYGGVVTATNTGTISTDGAYSFGIAAQSVSGSGGQGANGTFASGGSGGAAGGGGNVTATNTGTIETLGLGSTAILAQSIGGGNALDAFAASTPTTNHTGGGAGGKSGLFGSGGDGGAGGPGGNVTVNQNGIVSTFGDQAYGVLLQSIGGGGGTGGVGASSGAFLAVALGGGGGSGGDGGLVTFNSERGSIETSGSDATAILAQSIGGGGGTGGYATAKSVGPGLSASSAIGGSGGGGGKGGTVNVSNASSLTTEGDFALGIQAISIGGGGGIGGGANAFAVALPAVTPSGQSLPSITVTNAVGGSGGTGGSGSTVSVTNGGAITTFGTDATGIQAQSIGGGGGNAGSGSAYGLAVAAPGSTALNSTSAIGGSGGGGGGGGNADVYNSGAIRTYGDGAIGIQAQSIGGGGGNAGAASASADALSLYRTVALGEAVGGSNKDGGGAGGTASITHFGSVETSGVEADGLFAQSIGGGGGNGGGIDVSAASGLSFDKTLNNLVQKLPLADSLTIVDGIGGTGGRGGDGGTVNVTVGSGSALRTYGSQSDGVFAQSVGGGGGTGGGGSAATDGKLAIKLSVGGTGGAGGIGGAVNVFNNGTIETYGDGSHGVFAQSIGGGGGNGGNLTADDTKTPDRVGEIWKTLKDAVGVTAYNAWAADKGNAETKEKLDEFIKDIQSTDTYKSLSDSFKKSDFYKQMQSFGKNITDYMDKQKKGATKLPDLSLALSMGGSGGTGNKGGDVTVINPGSISTYGDVAHGVFGQSIGGGGGQGGVAYASGTNKTNLSATFGGSGGSGNIGGVVNVTNAGAVRTEGDGSYGLFAQSVGGGGGVGVGALSGGNKNVVINVTMGASGGTGGTGGTVTVVNSGTINTSGDEAHALVAQSIGGGGGAFTMNPANGGKTKTDTATGADAEVSDDTIRALLKAVGIEQVPSATGNASEDNSKKSGGFTLGGSGGSSGVGGGVNVTHSGSIYTSGEGAIGILAQSIGGGGGISNAAGSTGGVKYAASYGGAGGAGGDGGLVTLKFDGDARIGTTGENSTAVLAQSIGGGGGYGGASVLQGWTLPIVGGAGGSSGNGRDIRIEMERPGATLTIKTTGDAAHGVFAQTLGGGGGTVSNLLKTDTTVRDSLKLISGILDAVVKKGGGTGKLVDNVGQVPEALQSVVRLLGNDTDTVNTAVAKLTALLNQRSASVGTGGAIDISLAGSIVTSGAGSFAVFAQSGFQDLDGNLDPSRKGQNISISYTGVLTGGSGEGAAIGVDGGWFNKINIGSGSVISASSGTAILSSFGSEEVSNEGTVIGDVKLSVRSADDEHNRFLNKLGGTYRSNPSGVVDLGRAGEFYNEGVFDVAGPNEMGTATVRGNRFEQLPRGVLAVDVTSTPTAGQAKSDLLKITGNANLDGGVRVNVVGGLTPDTFRVLSADGSVGGRLTSAGPAGAPFVWNTKIDAHSVDISPEARFAPVSGLSSTDSERAVMRYLQQVWGSGSISPDFAQLFGAFAGVETPQAYMQGIDSLVPEESSSTLTTQTLNARTSMSASLSCPVFEGASTLMQETNCAWARVIGNWTQQTSTSDLSGYNQNAITYRIGAQREVIDNWFVGVTAGFTQSWLNSADASSSTDGQGADAALSLKHQVGPWLFALSGHLGFGNYETDRVTQIGSDTFTASGAANILTAGGRFRASYEFALSSWYVRPYADFDVLYTYMPAYNETGTGTTFEFSSANQVNFAFSPNVEVGGRFDLSPNLWLRPYASAGMTFFTKDSMPIDVSFAGASDLITDFVTEVAIPSTLVNLSAGVQLFDTKGYEVRAEYKVDIGDNYLSQELSARFAVQF